MSAYVSYEARAFDAQGDSRFHFYVRAVSDCAQERALALAEAQDMWEREGDGPAEEIVSVTLTRSIPSRIGKPRRVVPVRVL